MCNGGRFSRWLPVAAFVPAIVTFGCGHQSIIGDADAYGDTGTESDTSWDSSVDISADSMDAGTDVADSPTDDCPDAPVDSLHDALADAAPDPEVDIDEDAAPDAFPDGVWIPCNIVDQTGCPGGGWCAMMLDEESCHLYETCAFGTRGTLGPGEACSMTSGVRCVPGSDCYFDDFEEEPWPASCHEWCHTDADCTVPGATCWFGGGSIPAIGPCSGVVVTFPLNLCWI